MIPVQERRSLFVARRNRGGFLLGASWSYHPSFGGPRLTHFYLGWWVLTLRTGWDKAAENASGGDRDG